MRLYKVLLTGYLLILITACSAQQSEKRIALVIGNGVYEYTGIINSVCYDTDFIASELKKYKFKVVKGINCKKDSFLVLFNHFIQESDSFDVCLVYYNGHAVNYEGKSYIIPTDADSIITEEIESDLIEFNCLIKKIQSLGLKKNFIFTDTYRPTKFVNFQIKAGITDMQVPENFCMVWSAYPTSVGNSYSRPGVFADAMIKYMSQKELMHRNVIKSMKVQIWKITEKSQLLYFQNNIDEPFYFNQN